MVVKEAIIIIVVVVHPTANMSIPILPRLRNLRQLCLQRGLRLR